MPHTRIVCIGNPYHPEDRVGYAVFTCLTSMPLLPGVDIVDGGLQGLNLLACFDNTSRVIFVDTLAGNDDTPEDITLINNPVITATAGQAFDHASGLGYLLQAAPLVQEHLPDIWVVGASAGADDATISRISQLCREMAQRPCHAA